MANTNLDGPRPKCSYLDLLAAESGNALVVASTGVVYGKCFPLMKNVSFGFICRFTSPGNVTVKVELESGIAPPTTEGSSDTEWGVGDIVIAAVTATTVQVVAAAPVVAPYARLKLTGSGSNDALTTLAKAYLTFEKNL